MPDWTFSSWVETKKKSLASEVASIKISSHRYICFVIHASDEWQHVSQLIFGEIN
jgi:hypothetical protein